MAKNFGLPTNLIIISYSLKMLKNKLDEFLRKSDDKPSVKKTTSQLAQIKN